MESSEDLRGKALTVLREWMERAGFCSMIIPMSDPHFSEYTQERYKVIEWLTGFSGSSGTLVISGERAALWTDSRYFLQASNELDARSVRLMRTNMPGTPDIFEWLASQYENGGKIALDGALFSYGAFIKMEKDFMPFTLVPVDDPFDDIWKERPPLAFGRISFMPSGISGEETASKAERIKREAGVKESRFLYVLTALDDVAWLCNIRGCDIPYNRVPVCYAVVTNSTVNLFADLDSIDENTAGMLRAHGVELHPYNKFESILKDFPDDFIRVADPFKISIKIYRNLSIPGAVFHFTEIPGGITGAMKAVKNNWELDGFDKSFLNDGLAWCKFLKYLEGRLNHTGGEDGCITEYEAGVKLMDFRKENCDYVGESFEPIIAFGPSAALPHYSCNKTNCRKIEGDGLLLIDTGAHYKYGTTDTTRTIPVGVLDDEEKSDYTLVLKGMIDLSMAKFPAGTRGSNLDILARAPLYGEGKMYYHGTGHGIGHSLCVHEGPQSIRMEENPVPLVPGMVISNEPAVYVAGKYGIRIENAMAVENCTHTVFNDFYSFKTFTRVPICTSCIKDGILSESERIWLNTFNKSVFRDLKPLLDEETSEWLEKYTSDI